MQSVQSRIDSPFSAGWSRFDELKETTLPHPYAHLAIDRLDQVSQKEQDL